MKSDKKIKLPYIDHGVDVCGDEWDEPETENDDGKLIRDKENGNDSGEKNQFSENEGQRYCWRQDTST